MFWVNPSSEPAFTIFGIASAWTDTGNWWWLRCTDLVTGNDDLIFGVNGDFSQTSGEGTAVLNSGTWTHIAVVRSGNAWTVYVDGVSDVSLTKDLNGATSKIIEGNVYDPNTGGAAHTTDSFDGRFAASKAWQAALTAQEIRSEMKRVHPVRRANLFEFWPAENDGYKFTGRAKGINWTGVNTPTYEEGPPIQFRGSQLLVFLPTSSALVLVPTGIASSEAMGAPTLSQPKLIIPTGIASAEAMGAPLVGKQSILPTGIASAEAMGAPLVGKQLILPAGIASSEAMGPPTLVLSGQTIFPTGIGSGEGMGAPTLSQPKTLIPTGIVSAEAMGAPTLLGGIPTPGGTPGTGFAEAALARAYFGKSVDFRHPLHLLPINDLNHEAKNVNENFRRIDEWVRPFGGNQPEPLQLARLLGCAYVTGRVAPSTDGSGTADGRFSHKLGRIPTMILLAVDMQGLGGVVYGLPSGGNGTAGGNQTPWTKTDIYVRASRDSTYAFFVI